MSDPVRFLTAFSQALSTLGLYGDEHPATRRACETAYRHLTDLQAVGGTLEFTFLPGEVLFGRDLVQGLEGWEWSTRFSRGAIERLEVSGPVEPEHFERFLGQAAAAVGVGETPPGGWQGGEATIRFGRVRVAGSVPYQALLVPDVAIGSEQVRKFVYVVNNENSATIKYVTTGVLVDGLRVIKEGLAPDDRVIVNGMARVRPGAKVTPQKDDKAPGQSGPVQQKSGTKPG